MDVQTFTPDDSASALIAMFQADLGDHTGPFGLLAQFRVHQGAETRVSSYFEEARSRTLSDPGCLAFEVNRHAADYRRFVVYERWGSLAALDAHLRMPHTVKLRDALNQLIDGLPEFIALTPTELRVGGPEAAS
jgi:quinol monooxygenase YgiN